MGRKSLEEFNLLSIANLTSDCSLAANCSTGWALRITSVVTADVTQKTGFNLALNVVVVDSLPDNPRNILVSWHKCSGQKSIFMVEINRLLRVPA